MNAGKRLLHLQGLVLAGMLLVGGSQQAFAQRAANAAAAGAAAAAPNTVRLRDFPKVGRASLVRSPEYQSNVNRLGRGARRKEWALLQIEYETAPEWMDELVFTFYVMTQDAKREYNYFETTVTYVDIARGDHYACVALPPAAVARYGEPIAFGVEVVADGQPAAFGGVGPTEKWWTKIGENPNINKRPGYLVDRSKTPFAWAFVDDYEAVR